MYVNNVFGFDIWRIHYTNPVYILPIEKLAFVVASNECECWDEKFDTGFPDRTEALLIAAQLQIAYHGKYAFIVRPHTYKTLFNSSEEGEHVSNILQYIKAELKPKEELKYGDYDEEEDEYVSEEEEEYARDEAIAESKSEIFLDRKFEKYDYYEGPDLSDLEHNPW